MARLSNEAFERAREFIFDNGRRLEQVLFRHHFDSPCVDEVVKELSQFQNLDGGFGHAIEPDFRLPDSSALATTVALQVAADLELDSWHPLVVAAVGYLLQTFDSSLDAWVATPPNVNDYPHAPWWHQDPSKPHDAKALRLNPGVEVVAYLTRWGAANYDTWIRKVVDATDMLTPDQFLCCIALAETPGLLSDVRGPLVALIQRSTASAVETMESKWASYCIKPLTAAPSPDSLLASHFKEAIDRQFDYEIGRQSGNGAWLPHWTWGDRYPEAWPIAKREWSGEITLKTLRSLAAYDRL